MKNDVAGLDEWKTERFRDCSLLQTRGSAGERASMNDPLFWIGVVQALVFLLQLFVFWCQAVKLRESVDAAKAQSKDMERSTEQTTRAANAMEISSKAATLASQAATARIGLATSQMSAYLSVVIGSGVFQESARNLRFDRKSFA